MPAIFISWSQSFYMFKPLWTFLAGSWWRHQLETFPRYWPFVRRINWSPVNFPQKGQWCRALMFSLICALNKWLSKYSWGWWVEIPWRLLRRHFDDSLPDECEISTMLLGLVVARGLEGLTPLSLSTIGSDESRWVMVHLHKPDSKVHGANMGPIWGRQDPGGPNVGPMNLAIWVSRY